MSRDFKVLGAIHSVSGTFLRKCSWGLRGSPRFQLVLRDFGVFQRHSRMFQGRSRSIPEDFRGFR